MFRKNSNGQVHFGHRKELFVQRYAVCNQQLQIQFAAK